MENTCKSTDIAIRYILRIDRGITFIVGHARKRKARKRDVN